MTEAQKTLARIRREARRRFDTDDLTEPHIKAWISRKYNAYVKECEGRASLQDCTLVPDESQGMGEIITDKGERVPQGRQEAYWNHHEPNISQSVAKRLTGDATLKKAPYYYAPEKFKEHFNLRSVEFGNWMSVTNREQWLYGAASAMSLLAQITPLTHEQLGLGGRLSMAFGARGQGGFAAHYEHTPYCIINLTKTSGGSGVLVHEWGHAIDNVISILLGEKGQISGGVSTRKSIDEKAAEGDSLPALMERVIGAMYFKANGERTAFHTRQLEHTEYYQRRTEVWARIIEVWAALKTKGNHNPFLCDTLARYAADGHYPEAALVQTQIPTIDKIMAGLRDLLQKSSDKKQERKQEQPRPDDKPAKKTEEEAPTPASSEEEKDQRSRKVSQEVAEMEAREKKRVREEFEKYRREHKEHPFYEEYMSKQHGKASHKAADKRSYEGDPVDIETSTETIAAVYALVERSRLIASHDPHGFTPNREYPEGCQQRDYSHDVAEQQKVIRNAQNLNPKFLIADTPTATDGPPIVVAAPEETAASVEDVNIDRVAVGTHLYAIWTRFVRKDGEEREVHVPVEGKVTEHVTIGSRKEHRLLMEGTSAAERDFNRTGGLDGRYSKFYRSKEDRDHALRLMQEKTRGADLSDELSCDLSGESCGMSDGLNVDRAHLQSYNGLQFLASPLKKAGEKYTLVHFVGDDGRVTQIDKVTGTHKLTGTDLKRYARYVKEEALDRQTALFGLGSSNAKYIVLGGNSRTMSLIRTPHYDKYRAYLTKTAPIFGFTAAEVESMREPVLVRIVDVDLKKCATYSNILNKSLTQEIDQTTQSVSLARQLSTKDLESIGTIFEDSQSETIAEAMNDARIVREIITIFRRAQIVNDQNISTYLDPSTGSLSKQGKANVEGILLGSILPNKELIESARNYTDRILKVLPLLIRMNKLPEKYNLMPLIQDAIKNEGQRRAAGIEKWSYIRQISFDRPEVSQPVIVIWDQLDAGANKFKTFLQKYIQTAESEAQREQYGSMLIEMDPVSVEQAIDNAAGLRDDIAQSDFYTMADVVAIPQVPVELHRLAHFFGRLHTPFRMVIWGAEGSGKSTLKLMLESDLERSGTVIDVMTEESIRAGRVAERMRLTSSYLRNTVFNDNMTRQELIDFLIRNPNVKHVVIDSISEWDANEEQIKDLYKRFPDRNFVFIIQGLKDGSMHKGFPSLNYKVDTVIHVDESGTATITKHRDGEKNRTFKIFGSASRMTETAEERQAARRKILNMA